MSLRMVSHMPKYVSSTFGALADLTRRSILQLVSAARVDQRAARPRIALPTVLEHVRVLEETQLLTTRRWQGPGVHARPRNASTKLGMDRDVSACGNGGSTHSTVTSRLVRGDAGDPGHPAPAVVRRAPDVVFDARTRIRMRNARSGRGTRLGRGVRVRSPCRGRVGHPVWPVLGALCRAERLLHRGVHRLAYASTTEWPDGSHIESLMEISLQWLDGRTPSRSRNAGSPPVTSNEGSPKAGTSSWTGSWPGSRHGPRPERAGGGEGVGRATVYGRSDRKMR